MDTPVGIFFVNIDLADVGSMYHMVCFFVVHDAREQRSKPWNDIPCNTD